MAHDLGLFGDAFDIPHRPQPSSERLRHAGRISRWISWLLRSSLRAIATMVTVLRDAGWSTFWIGKNHNVPVDAFDMASSRKYWPLGLGYDRFYGFIGGETNQG